MTKLFSVSSSLKLIPVIFLFICIQPVSADQVTMLNGDIITGSVVKKDSTILKFKTEYAGTLEINWKDVRQLQMETPAKVLLKDESVITLSKINGPTIPKKPATDGNKIQPEIVSIKPEPWELGKGAKFSGRVNLSAKQEKGNGDSDEFDADFELRYRRLDDRFDLKGQIEIDREDRRKTKRDWDLLGKYDYFITDNDYISGWYGAKQEKFAGLNLRQSIGISIGHQFFEQQDLTLESELGLFYVDEDYIDIPDNYFYGPGFFVNYEQELVTGRIWIYHRNAAFFDAENSSKRIWHSWTGFRFPIYQGLVASAEYELDYDSQPALNADTTDTTIRLKLGYEW